MTVRRPERTHASPPARAGRLAGAAALLSVSFVASRLLGLLRNVVIAGIFGTSREAEAYFAAFRLPDAMFLLVSGGALAAAFVPVFSGLLERDEDEAWRVAGTVFTGLVLVLAGLAAIAFLFADPIMGALVPHYAAPERSLTVELTRIMLLQPIFLGAQAIVTSILQTYHRFLLTAVAPLVYNVAVIIGAVVFAPHFGAAALAWSVSAGALLMLLVQLPGLPGRRMVRTRVDFHLPAVREILTLMGPRVIGAAAFQAMLFITLYLAQGLPQGNVAAINYAWILIYFPVGALGTAAATAIFPTLSRLTVQEDLPAVQVTVNRSLRLVVFFAIPAAVGLIVLRRPIINLLYNHGSQWSHRGTEQTAFALLFYALAIAPLVAIEVLPRVFYAMRDTVTPVRIAVVTVGLDAVLSVVLVRTLPRSSGQGGLALATAIATTVQAVWLARTLETRLGTIGAHALRQSIRDSALASLIMGMALYVVLDPLVALFGTGLVGSILVVGLGVVLGGGLFAAVSYWLGAPELEQVRAIMPGSK
jgi:putative peptidoglycan lipid II flippase